MEEDKKLQRARNNAYALLRSRPRSESEMRFRLRMKGCAKDAIEDVVAGLKRIGDIDDGKFARFWVESRMHNNPAGDMMLRRELKDKGISDRIIEEVLAEKAGNYDEYKVALAIAGERFKNLAKLDRRKAMKRLYDFLLRRGFSYDIVQRVIEALINENG